MSTTRTLSFHSADLRTQQPDTLHRSNSPLATPSNIALGLLTRPLNLNIDAPLAALAGIPNDLAIVRKLLLRSRSANMEGFTSRCQVDAGAAAQIWGGELGSGQGT